jgi:deazaflavin-dependent oxidoreductase (nitroreductase family)
MGLASELGYSIGERGAIRRGVAALGSTRPVSAVSNKVIRPIDRFVLGLSGGRSTATSWLIGIPPLWVTTTGVRSGMARVVPLFGIPIREDLALLGTSFGQRATPAWVRNLEHEPRVSVTFRGIEVAAVARPADEKEKSTIWESAAAIYQGYSNYADWASHREIKVFVLESAGD